MNSDTDLLLARAEAAEPENSARPRRWVRLWPVYEALRARGFSCQRAVQWLISEGAVSHAEQARALNAFHILSSRRNRRKAAVRAAAIAKAHADAQAEAQRKASSEPPPSLVPEPGSPEPRA
jgi:hypothetical protein